MHHTHVRLRPLSRVPCRWIGHKVYFIFGEFESQSWPRYGVLGPTTETHFGDMCPPPSSCTHTIFFFGIALLCVLPTMKCTLSRLYRVGYASFAPQVMPISQREATILHSASLQLLTRVFLQPCLSRALVKRPAGTWKRGHSSPSQHDRPTSSASASSKAGILLIGDEILSGKVPSLPGIPSPFSALSVSFQFTPSTVCQTLSYVYL